MILTEEFLNKAMACVEGFSVGMAKGYIGMEYNEVIKALLKANYREYAGWMLEAKKTELYVRMNGSVITMGAYQIFNPLTGTHTRYETEAEAKTALIEVSKQLLNYYCPQVVQELSNENGDTTWIPTTLHETLTIS